MKKILLIFAISSMFLKGDNIIVNKNVNNYGVINNAINDNNDFIKIENESRILDYINRLNDSNLKPIEKSTISVLTGIAKKINNYNIHNSERRKKCIEYSLKFKFYKIDIGLAKKICNEIFK